MDTRKRWCLALVIAIALAATATSLGNGFVLDDVVIVEKNAAVHSLTNWWQLFATSYWPLERGGGLYRPLPMLTWAVEWTVSGGAPWIFHAGNIVLYAILAAAVLRLMWVIVPDWRAALVGAALFAAHPVHVEAVGNVVALTELMSALCVVLAMVAYIERRRAGALSARDVVLLAALYAGACLSKENGAMLPLLLLAADVILVRDKTPWAERARRALPLVLALVVVAGGYMALRLNALQMVKGEYPHVVWVVVPRLTRQLTMIGVAMEWLRLLFWPLRLSAEYTPPYIRIVDDWTWALVPALMMVYFAKGLMVVAFKRAPMIAFASAWLVVTLFPVSNTVIVAGLILAERTLLLPSVAAVLVGAWAAQVAIDMRQAPRAVLWRRVGAAAAVLAVIAGTWRSAQRQLVWHDNERLFKQTVVDAPRAYRAHYNLGAWFMERGALADGERELRSAIALFPHDYEPMAYLANEYRKRDLCGPAVPLYQAAILLAPRAADVRAGYTGCLIAGAQFDSARALAKRGVGKGWAGELELKRLLGVADSIEAALNAQRASGRPCTPSRSPRESDSRSSCTSS